MAHQLLNPFDHRQVMQKPEFEIFHYNNPAICSCPPHQHDFFELFYLMGDGVDEIVDGLRYTLHQGDIMLVSPGQMHRPDVPGRVRSVERFVLWLNVDYVKSIVRVLPHTRYTLLGDLRGRNIIQADGEADVAIKQLLLALHREADQEFADSAQLCRAIVSQILIYCSRSMARAADRLAPKAELRYHEIMQVYEHIMFHLRDDLSVSGLADRFFMDKNTLTRQFKRQVGMTPGECIRWLRLENARQLILSGTPTQTACVECGFSDYSAFYRAFRQAYGLNPRDYAAREREAVV
ncbi:MAG: helix-turn-helix domain-containing protein [Clostridia bacterium]|nr:helix-turn-helix domain-containing protein [Clostridia bacterium]